MLSNRLTIGKLVTKTPKKVPKLNLTTSEIVSMVVCTLGS
jgi:hypothetical protein